MLKYCLAQFKVQVCPEGWLTFHGGIQLHLILACTQSLWRLLETAWEECVREELQKRKACQDLPVPSFAETRRAFSELPRGADTTLVEMHLTGGVATGDGRAHIYGDDPTCSHCGQEDTIAHRVLRCTFTTEDHPAMGGLTESQATLPWVPRIPGLCRLWQALHSRPRRDHVQQVTLQRTRIWTDGSASSPDMLLVDDAAYAIIIERLEGIDPATHAQQSRTTHECPQAFEIVYTGKVYGYQSISRAELQAIADAIRMFPCSTIFSDSAYAIGRISFEPFINGPNSDILQRFGFIFRNVTKRRLNSLKSKVIWEMNFGQDPTTNSS